MGIRDKLFGKSEAASRQDRSDNSPQGLKGIYVLILSKNPLDQNKNEPAFAYVVVKEILSKTQPESIPYFTLMEEKKIPSYLGMGVIPSNQLEDSVGFLTRSFFESLGEKGISIDESEIENIGKNYFFFTLDEIKVQFGGPGNFILGALFINSKRSVTVY